MTHFRAAGLLALGLLLLPLVWTGYADLSDALAAPGAARAGGVCVIDGAQPVEHVYLLARQNATPNPNARTELVEGYNGYCKLATPPPAHANRSWWMVSVQRLQEGYDADLVAGGQNFPPLEWEWPITLTWAGESRSLAPGRWSTRLLAQMLQVAPVLSLFAMIALPLREYVQRGNS